MFYKSSFLLLLALAAFFISAPLAASEDIEQLISSAVLKDGESIYEIQACSADESVFEDFPQLINLENCFYAVVQKQVGNSGSVYFLSIKKNEVEIHFRRMKGEGQFTRSTGEIEK